MIDWETDRCVARRATEDDAAFVVALTNDPDWRRFIGDSRVRDEGDARGYIERALAASYREHGHGLDVVELAETGEAIGLCGLVARDALEVPDLGFAFLPEFRGRGLAEETARGALAHAREVLGLERVLAITTEENHASIALLERLGFRLEGPRRVGDEELLVFARPLD